jgi:hypothetical protein
VEVVKFLLAGADVVATASALLRHGPEHMRALVDGLQRWLSQNAFASVTEIRGRLDGTHVDRADKFLRTQYLRTISESIAVVAPQIPERATLIVVPRLDTKLVPQPEAGGYDIAAWST